MRRKSRGSFIVFCLILGSMQSAEAIPIDQYADTVLDFSSQWSSGNWGAHQVLGAPDTFAYGDIETAWAPRPENGSLEYITVGFADLVYADGVTIRETYGNGFVYQVDVIDESNALHQVWSGLDSSLPGSPVDFLVSWAQTSYLVGGIKIYTDTDHDPNAWEEIDSIQLHGHSVAVPEPATIMLLGLGLVALGLRRRTNPGALRRRIFQ